MLDCDFSWPPEQLGILECFISCETQQILMACVTYGNVGILIFVASRIIWLCRTVSWQRHYFIILLFFVVIFGGFKVSLNKQAQHEVMLEYNFCCSAYLSAHDPIPGMSSIFFGGVVSAEMLNLQMTWKAHCW